MEDISDSFMYRLHFTNRKKKKEKKKSLTKMIKKKKKKKKDIKNVGAFLENYVENK
jgi:hypothetical protein